MLHLWSALPPVQINNGGQFREFFLKCVNAGNTRAICYAGLHAATSIGLEESIEILEPNVPRHGLSTLDVVIFNVCIGRDKEASQVFQLLAAHHGDLRSEDIFDMGDSIQWLLKTFNVPFLNTYGSSFQFPVDEVIMPPKCFYDHDYTVGVEGSCKNYKLYWICCNVCYML
ncbi:hypothetical protein F2Q69_00005520 [Brassica cretica]|uniref:Uncharacterized protein n=1 Tax=Brassica cretica TaxID=69181 RepID=A0A8S9PJK4_BRACR|nr:hypothetical protein F2Q69_00005520 [Brassica cretica]